MSKQNLNPKILIRLKKRFPEKTDNAIWVKLSKLSRKNNVTLNAAAEIWGKKDNFSVWGLLGEKDRDSLKDKNFQIIKIKTKDKSKKKIMTFVDYDTSNKFLQKHLEEINRCYTYSCYTAAFILIRKVIENLIVEIINKKFPNTSDKYLYLDLGRGRIHDLSKLIANLRKKSTSFSADEKKLIQRILFLSDDFKNDANDKTHSLYHISGKTELENKNPQQILDLIQEYFSKY